MTTPHRLFRFPVEALLLGAIALAVLLRIVWLGSREFWYDEVLSLLFAAGQRIFYDSPEEVPVTLANYTPLLSLPAESGAKEIVQTTVGLLRGIVGVEPHPFLFYLSQNVWLRLTGNGETVQRLMGMGLSVGAIACSYGTGKLLMGHRGGLIYAALMGLSPLYFFHSLNLRMYGPVVFWVCLSTLALLQLIYGDRPRLWQTVLWSAVFIGAIAGAMLTFYPAFYWVMALAVAALVIDRKRWWQHGVRFVAGGAIVVPWAMWGLPQQLRNADFGRFNAPPGILATALTHAQGMLKTMAIHLLVGDWATSLSDPVLWALGAIGVLLWAGMVWTLWQRESRLLSLGLLLGVLPLVIALAADIASGKFTFGFGNGRSVIFGLPGMVLILAIWLEKARVNWRSWAILGALFIYLGVTGADFIGRDRQMFHQINAAVNQAPDTPTLIALNSKAWGHVMRLAYYVNPEAPVDLLAVHPGSFPQALETTLADPNQPYERVLWLDPARSVWEEPETKIEADAIRQQATGILEEGYQVTSTQSLAGTMDLDKFTLTLYEPS
ncbi:MAG: glycosyltransferase family 39 protein [Cyanobacteria bacterium P01_D01_bin.128]